MAAVLKRPPLYRRPEEIGRRVIGTLLEFGIKAYGEAAAVSVALSDEETVVGKGHDALAAVPNLMERYRDTKYLVDHREEIQRAVNLVHQHAPDAAQLNAAVQKSSETLKGIRTTYSEVTQAWEALHNINLLESFPQAKEHVTRAWAEKPDLDSIRHLVDKTQNVEAFLKQLGVLDIDVSRHYGDLLRVMDNFASDEIAATLGVMGAALGLALAFGMGVGFWARRGRPGFIAGTLQRWGARRFRGWYVRNLEYALGRSLYAVARASASRATSWRTRRRRSTRKHSRNSSGTSSAGSERNRPPRRGLS